MATITLTFANPINTSVQPGDVVLYSNTSSVGGFTTAQQSDVVLLGPCTSITTSRLAMDVTYNNTTTAPPTTSSFIMFSKDKYSNPSGVDGYYAEVCFKNTSTTESELFGVNVDAFESSK